MEYSFLGFVTRYTVVSFSYMISGPIFHLSCLCLGRFLLGENKSMLQAIHSKNSLKNLIAGVWLRKAVDGPLKKFQILNVKFSGISSNLIPVLFFMPETSHRPQMCHNLPHFHTQHFPPPGTLFLANSYSYLKTQIRSLLLQEALLDLQAGSDTWSGLPQPRPAHSGSSFSCDRSVSPIGQ